jgi:hypothetical protein
MMPRIVLVAVLALGAGGAAAQSTVPVSREPRHHFQFENPYVRVYDVVVPVGDTTYFHVHSVDYTYVSIGAANLVAQALGSEPAPLVLGDGEVRFTKGPITHRVWNVGAVPFHNITIELLKRDSASRTPPALDAGDSLVLHNERLTVVRHRLAGGEVFSPAGSAGGPRALHVYLTRGRVEVTDSGGVKRAVDVKPGSFLWSDRVTPRSIRNMEGTPLDVLTFHVR